MNMVFVETQADFASAESFTSDLGNFFIVEMNNKKTKNVSLLLISENGQNKIHRLYSSVFGVSSDSSAESEQGLNKLVGILCITLTTCSASFINVLNQANLMLVF